MCGRYSLVFIDDLGNRFRVHNPLIGTRSRFTIAPGTESPVITGSGERRLLLMTWGIPVQTGGGTERAVINARAETITGKRTFADLFRTQRCLVPASGFFEWSDERGHKTPWYIHLKNERLFAFAGLYTFATGREGAGGPAYTIITTAPNELVAPLHNRMPVIIPREKEAEWLAADIPDPGAFLKPYTATEMEAYQVSPRVNAPGADDAGVIEPLFRNDGDRAGGQTTLL